MGSYKMLSQEYEALNPKDEIFKQRGFFEKLLKAHDIHHCLDCACGTGWHLFMLADLGVTCYGSDLSPSMLTIAQQNLKGLDITLKQGDFRKLSSYWDQKFDMIICMSNSFNHMLKEPDVIIALRSMYDQLNPKGILVIDNGISDRLINSQPKFIPARISQTHAFYFVLEYPCEKQIIFNILGVKKTPDGFAHSFNTLTYNALSQFQLRACFDKTPFQHIDYMGSFQFETYNPNSSPRLIAIAQK